MKRIIGLVLGFAVLAYSIWVFVQGFGKNPSWEFAAIGAVLIAGAVMTIVGSLLRVNLQKLFNLLICGVAIAVTASVLYNILAPALQTQNLNWGTLVFATFVVLFIIFVVFSFVRSWRRGY